MKYILLMLITLLFFSCEDEVVEVRNSGSIKGAIEKGTTNTIFENIHVSLQGGEIHLQTISDSHGVYQFDNVESGVYNLVFSHDSACTNRMNGVQHVGGNDMTIVPRVPVYRKIECNTIIDSISIEKEVFNDDYLIDFYTSNVNHLDKTYHSHLVFFSNSPNVSYKNYDFYQDFDVIRIPKNLYDKNEEIFFIIYPYTPFSNYYYIDPENGGIGFSSLNSDCPSNVKSVILSD